MVSWLADYWADVYEYTQARHFENLENWVGDSSELVLNPNRPFLSVIEPIREELENIYAKEYPSYEDVLEKNWSLRDRDERLRDE